MAQFGLDAALEFFKLDRRTQFLKVFNYHQYQAHKVEARPAIVLVGSCRTARNVDGALLQSSLQRQDIYVRVAQLSSPGSFAFEQDYYLERFLGESSYLSRVAKYYQSDLP